MTHRGYWLSPHPQSMQNDSTGGCLFTPPEENVHRFSCDKGHSQMEQPTQCGNEVPPIVQAYSPPISQANDLLPNLAIATGFSSQDPQLYPDPLNDGKMSQTPLFRCDEEVVRGDQKLAKAVGAAALVAPDRSPECRKDRSERPRIYPDIVGVATPLQALDYFYRRTAELRNYNGAISKLARPMRTISAASRQDFDQHQSRKASQPAIITRTRRVRKQASQPASITRKRPYCKQASRPMMLAAASPRRSLPPWKRTPLVPTLNEPITSTCPSASQSAKYKRAPPSKEIEDNKSTWMELADYAPPIATLNRNGKVLKVKWNARALDLAADASRNHLHPQELHIASILRLTGELYLLNKRRIFEAKVQAQKDGKKFTKTAAQRACSIDVNKASQLREAFDAVGWFEETWFERYM